MRAFRLLVPFVAVLLAVVITVEVTDVLRCANEVRVAVLDQPAEDARPGKHDSGHHGPVDDSHRSEHLPDCFCHVIFVPTAALPEVGTPTEIAFQYPLYVAAAAEGEVPLPGHVPIG